MKHDPLPPATLIWIDIEFTSADQDTAEVLELAARATNRDLLEIARPVDLIVRPEKYSRDALPDVVREMHEKSGLLDAVEAHGHPLGSAESTILEWLSSLPGESVFVHCGYYLELDRLVMSRQLPRFKRALGFRTFDLRTLEEAADAWTTSGRFARTRSGRHRALGDVDEALAMANDYREYFNPAIGQ